MRPIAWMLFIAVLAGPALAVPDLAEPSKGVVVRRYRAVEARQGVAVGRDRFFAIGDREIAAYDRASGNRVAQWSGDPTRFTHLNSCVAVSRELVCAHSNYPGVPMVSSVETFDARTLRHLRSQRIGPGVGSLTWIVHHGGYWWAGFANYDGKGGTPGRDHRFTTLVKYDRALVERGRWRFPDDVLSRFAPKSSSGGVWGDDGLLYVTGHDRAEVYVLALPRVGAVLDHVATISIETAGQAISWDPAATRQLWSINRPTGEVVVTRLPRVY